jgi:hypothetical protein
MIRIEFWRNGAIVRTITKPNLVVAFRFVSLYNTDMRKCNGNTYAVVQY